MIIILEGPEAAGKSTLANKLSMQTGYPIVHRDKPKTEEDKLRMMEYYLAAVGSDKNFIFDRCWYSEIVYGTVMRDKSYISYEQMYQLETALAKNGGGMIIHCTDHLSLLWDRMITRGDDYINEIDDLANLTDMFHHVLHRMPHHIPVVKYELSKNMHKV